MTHFVAYLFVLPLGEIKLNILLIGPGLSNMFYIGISVGSRLGLNTSNATYRKDSQLNELPSWRRIEQQRTRGSAGLYQHSKQEKALAIGS